MINQLMLIGRLVDDPVIKEVNDKKLSNITVAVPRAFKNKDGIYETDFIDCTLWHGIAENTAEYCKKGDLIGVKGRLQTSIKDGVKHLEVIPDKITFLATKQKADSLEQEKNIQM